MELASEVLEICSLSLLDHGIKTATKYLTSKSEECPEQAIQVVQLDPDEILVINKPADLVINSDDPSRESVQQILKRQLPHLADPTLGHDFYFVHRLDYATSGLLCIPLNKKRCAEISQLFERRLVQKFYLAIVRGHVEQDESIVDIPVGEDIRYKTTSNKMCTSHDWEHCLAPRQSKTHLVVLERGLFQNDAATKVLLKPITGRRHQLRVHCSAIGHPIVGDFTYSLFPADRNEDPHRVSPSRMMLHAVRLKIPATTGSAGLDLSTEDPLRYINGIPWHGTEPVYDLNCALKKLSDNTSKDMLI